MPNMPWDEAMKIWKSLPKEEHDLLRRAAVQRLIDGGAEEVGTSDVNHSVYYLVSTGDFREAIAERRREEEV